MSNYLRSCRKVGSIKAHDRDFPPIQFCNHLIGMTIKLLCQHQYCFERFHGCSSIRRNSIAWLICNSVIIDIPLFARILAIRPIGPFSCRNNTPVCIPTSQQRNGVGLGVRIIVASG